MGSLFFQLNLADIPPPDAVEMLEFERILLTYVTDTKTRLPELEKAITLQQSPANVILQSQAYGDMLVRARINAAVRAVLLATSSGADLDNIGAMFGVVRIVQGDYRESDSDLRRRIQLAPEAWAAAGPPGAYLFHTLSAQPGVEEAAVYNHTSGLVSPGEVLVVVMTRNGFVQREVIDAVQLRLNHQDVKPLTDAVSVIPAKRHLWDLDATLNIRVGPDRSLVVAEARKRVEAYLKTRRKIGQKIPLSGIMQALHFGPVMSVSLSEPTTDVQPGLTEYADVTTIQLTGAVDVSG